MSARAARERLTETLRRVEGVAVVLDVGQQVLDPPALVLTPPKLAYDVYGPGPSDATFTVPLVVRQDEDAIERLDDLLELVQAVVYDSADAALTGVQPGRWGTPPLPCYLLTIEVSV